MPKKKESDEMTTATVVEWLSPRQVGALLGLSDQTIRRMIRAGQLPAKTTPGGYMRVNRRDVPDLADAPLDDQP